MTDIFISYAREDVERVRSIVQILEEQEWSVWWDRTILPGKRFREEIHNALNQAKCVIVVWSSASVKRDFVLDEITYANNKGLSIIPAIIEKTEIPLGFGAFQAVDLSDWSEGITHPEFRKIVSALTSILSKRPESANELILTAAKHSAKLERGVPSQERTNWRGKIVLSERTHIVVQFNTDVEHVLEWVSFLGMVSTLALDRNNVSENIVTFRGFSMQLRFAFVLRDPSSLRSVEFIIKFAKKSRIGLNPYPNCIFLLMERFFYKVRSNGTTLEGALAMGRLTL